MATIYPDDLARRVAQLCSQLIREPATLGTDAATGDPVLTFEPPLTTAEQTTYANILRTLRSAVAITPAERQALEPDIATLRTYVGVTSPTAAQTAAATKAIIRVIRALFRD